MDFKDLHLKLYRIVPGCMIDHIEVKNIGLSTLSLSSIVELLCRINLRNRVSTNAINKVKSTIYNILRLRKIG